MFKLKPRFAPLMAALAIGVAAVGCAPGTGTAPNPTPTPSASADASAEAREHMAEGPALALTAATLEATESVPMVAGDHRRYDLALVASGSAWVGKVKLDNATAGDVVFYLNADVPLALTDAAGEAIAIEETGGPIAGSPIRQHYVAELGVGRYDLRFGPTSEASVSLVVEGGAHSHDH